MPCETEAVNAETQFDAQLWARRWNENEARAERNAYQDSGWSASEVHDTDAEAHRLAYELLITMCAVQQQAEDYFDRSPLAAVLAAAYLVTAKSKGGAK